MCLSSECPHQSLSQTIHISKNSWARWGDRKHGWKWARRLNGLLGCLHGGEFLNELLEWLASGNSPRPPINHPQSSTRHSLGGKFAQSSSAPSSLAPLSHCPWPCEQQSLSATWNLFGSANSVSVLQYCWAGCSYYSRTQHPLKKPKCQKAM